MGYRTNRMHYVHTTTTATSTVATTITRGVVWRWQGGAVIPPPPIIWKKNYTSNVRCLFRYGPLLPSPSKKNAGDSLLTITNTAASTTIRAKGIQLNTARNIQEILN